MFVANPRKYNHTIGDPSFDHGTPTFTQTNQNRTMRDLDLHGQLHPGHPKKKD